MKKADAEAFGWSPDFFLAGDGRNPHIPHPGSPRLADWGGHHLHPTLQRPTLPHLTPHRRGCPRRALFRVLGHPKVFALLFPKNAS